MEFYKDQSVTVTIGDMGKNGEGIGKIDGYTLFIKDAVIGDTVQAKIIKTKKSHGYARLIQILKPSIHRTVPPCPIARQCGGCQLQSLAYPQQLLFKEKTVRGNLEHIGGIQDIPMEPIVGMETPYNYRNKAQFPVALDKNGRIVTGFYAGRTHQIIPNRDCLLGIPENRQILDIVIDHMEKYRIPPYNEANGSGLVRHILIRYGFHTGEIMVCLVINGKHYPHVDRLSERLSALAGMSSIMLNINKERSNVILGKKTTLVWGRPTITDQIGDLRFHISPQSFFQVNPQQTEKMYAKALEYAALTGNETVWDLYCGIGTISLFMARSAKKVYGVEVIPQAVQDARTNAQSNHLENVEFFAGRAEEILPAGYKNGKVHADVIIVDPPRKGCDRILLDTILQVQPERIVYVSCDSATLARDVRYLHEGRYSLEKVCPFDNFPMTCHTECVVGMQRKHI